MYSFSYVSVHGTTFQLSRDGWPFSLKLPFAAAAVFRSFDGWRFVNLCLLLLSNTHKKTKGDFDRSRAVPFALWEAAGPPTLQLNCATKPDGLDEERQSRILPAKAPFHSRKKDVHFCPVFRKVRGPLIGIWKPNSQPGTWKKSSSY